MTPADQARAMGDYIREHGFSPTFQDGPVDSKCGCFLHAAKAVRALHGELWKPMLADLLIVIGAKTFYEDDLIAAGYASDADRQKAVDACYAAARMLEGK